MSFLAPLFLAALAAVAVPVLLHLTQREKKQVVRFPSLMFVRRIPYQSVRRRKIRDWLLLAIRAAALAALALAFARPFIDRSDTAFAAGAGAREVVVLLDTSYSMGYADRWARAQQAAQDAIATIAPADRASVVLFSSGASIAVRSTAEKSSLSAVIAAAKPGAGATRYAPALKVAGSIVAESPRPRREVLLISDFQRGGWRGEEGTRLPRGTTVTPVPIQGDSVQANVSLTAVSLARSTFSNRERVMVTAGVVNRSTRPVSGGAIALAVSGIPTASQPVTLEPGATASVTFEPFTVNDRLMRATVTLTPDALAADNTFHFVVSPSQPVRVTIVARGGGAASLLYLTRALAIGDAPRFEATVREPERLTDDDLKRSAVVILDDVVVSSTLGRRLARFVEQGGGLLVAAGPRAAWPSDVDLLPGVLASVVDRTRGDVARVGGLEYGHALFEPFRAPRSGDFSTVRVYGYRTVSASPGSQVLARFDSGTPAVLARRTGTGRVLLWASTLDNAWSDLPLKPVYLPFVHQAMRHLAAYTEPRAWMTVGQVLDPSVAAAQKAPSLQRMVLTPSGVRRPLQDEGTDVMELTEQGFYELRSGGTGSPTDIAVVASNVDPSESDLTPLDPKTVAIAAAGAPAGAQSSSAPPVARTPEARERSQRIWWFAMCAVALLLGADTLLSNRLSRA